MLQGDTFKVILSMCSFQKRCENYAKRVQIKLWEQWKYGWYICQTFLCARLKMLRVCMILLTRNEILMAFFHLSIVAVSPRNLWKDSSYVRIVTMHTTCVTSFQTFLFCSSVSCKAAAWFRGTSNNFTSRWFGFGDSSLI